MVSYSNEFNCLSQSKKIHINDSIRIFEMHRKIHIYLSILCDCLSTRMFCQQYATFIKIRDANMLNVMYLYRWMQFSFRYIFILHAKTTNRIVNNKTLFFAISIKMQRLSDLPRLNSHTKITIQWKDFRTWIWICICIVQR